MTKGKRNAPCTPHTHTLIHREIKGWHKVGCSEHQEKMSHLNLILKNKIIRSSENSKEQTYMYSYVLNFTKNIWVNFQCLDIGVCTNKKKCRSPSGSLLGQQIIYNVRVKIILKKLNLI